MSTLTFADLTRAAGVFWKSAGESCDPGETSKQTGCVPASGDVAGGGENAPAEGKPKKKPKRPKEPPQPDGAEGAAKLGSDFASAGLPVDPARLLSAAGVRYQVSREKYPATLAQYDPLSGRLTLVSHPSISPEEQLSAAVHELAHALDYKLSGKPYKPGSNDPDTEVGKLAAAALAVPGFRDKLTGLGYREGELPTEAVAWLASRWADKKLGRAAEESPELDALLPEFEQLLLSHAGKGKDGSDVREVRGKYKDLPDHQTKALETHKYGCLLLPLPADAAKEIVDWCLENVPDYHLGAGGRELRPHLTIKYGFKDDGEEVVAALKALLLRAGPVTLTLTRLALFRGNEDGDVLYAAVDSPQAEELNRQITAGFDTYDKYPTYVPHVCLAYLDPQYSDAYDLAPTPFLGQTITLTHAEYSPVAGPKTEIPLAAADLFAGQKALSWVNEAAGGALVQPPQTGLAAVRRKYRRKQLAAGRPDSDFDPAALAEGTRVEMEHTDDPEEAKQITKDHLVEDPCYYSKLRLIEGKAYLSAADVPFRAGDVLHVTQATTVGSSSLVGRGGLVVQTPFAAAGAPVTVQLIYPNGFVRVRNAAGEEATLPPAAFREWVPPGQRKGLLGRKGLARARSKSQGGSCQPGETAAQTGCTPATGSASQRTPAGEEAEYSPAVKRAEARRERRAAWQQRRRQSWENNWRLARDRQRLDLIYNKAQEAWADTDDSQEVNDAYNRADDALSHDLPRVRVQARLWRELEQVAAKNKLKHLAHWAGVLAEHLESYDPGPLPEKHVARLEHMEAAEREEDERVFQRQLRQEQARDARRRKFEEARQKIREARWRRKLEESRGRRGGQAKALRSLTKGGDSYFGECERDDLGHCLPSGGGSATPATPAPTKTDPKARRAAIRAVLASAGRGAVSLQRAARSAADQIGTAAWTKLSPTNRQKLARTWQLVKAVEHKVMLGFRKANELVVAAARERGLDETQTKTLARTLALTDTALAWTVNMPAAYAATGSSGVAKAASWVPVASLGYLAYSTARDPLATLRAAKKLVREGRAAGHKALDRGDLERLAGGLADRLREATDPDWLMALYCAALDKVKDPEKALELVDYLVKKTADHPLT